jgi:hypothetical protein
MLNVVGIGALNVDYVLPSEGLAGLADSQELRSRFERGAERLVDETAFDSTLQLLPAGALWTVLGGSAFNSIRAIEALDTELSLGYVGAVGATADPMHNVPSQAFESWFDRCNVQARINQEPAISSQITLWNREGSQVLRGNLLVIPLEDAVLYVQPLYIQAQSNPLPELKRVIVALTGAVVMSDRLDTALTALGQGRSGEVLATAPPAAPAPAPAAGAPAPATSTGDLATAARDHLRNAEAAAGRGDWAAYGYEMAQVHQLLDQLATAAGR